MNNSPATYKEKIANLKCVVVIPTYNNAGTIAQVIADVKQYASDIVVVNDGSTDQTAEILKNTEGIRVIEYAENKGKGYALKLALTKAFEWGYRYAITIDADGQHYADDIPTFIDRIEQVPDSLLIGARNLTADNMPSKNTFANKFSNFWYKVETGNTLSDTQSGFRLYPLERVQNIRLITRRYEFEVEIIVRAAWCGVNVENVPIKVYYAPEGERVSHFRPLQDFTRISILNTVLVLFAFLFYYPWRFIHHLTPRNIANFFDKQVIHSADSNARMAASMAWGIFSGIIPIWGYQMVFAGFTAHFMRLNKVVAIVFSNISIPPMIPFILYGSMAMGAWLLNIENNIIIEELSLEAVKTNIQQYLLGSVALAIVAGTLVFIVAFLTMTILRRKRRNE